MRRRFVSLWPLLVVVACSSTPVITPPAASPPPTGSPTVPATMAPSPIPSATPNRPTHAGAPAISEPYWLLDDGTSTSTVTDAAAVVLETDRSESSRVIDGGSIVGGILLDGEWIGLLEVTVTEGEAIPGLDPIEQQYGAQIDDVHPADDALDRSPNPYWIRTNVLHGKVRVFIRAPADPSDGASSEAFWWDAAHEKWYRLSVMTDRDFESVLTAVLGPARP